MSNSNKSSSGEQQRVESYLTALIEEWLGVQCERNKRICIADGVYVEPDLYSEKEKIICEMYAHIGTLKVGQQHKVSQDILKMLLLEKTQNLKFRKIIITIDASVETYLNGKSFIAEGIRQFGIEVERIDIPKEMRASITSAQERQYR